MPIIFKYNISNDNMVNKKNINIKILQPIAVVAKTAFF